MDVGQCQVVLRSYVIGAFAETFMPDSDVRNRDATARDPRLAAAHARGDRVHMARVIQPPQDLFGMPPQHGFTQRPVAARDGPGVTIPRRSVLDDVLEGFMVGIPQDELIAFRAVPVSVDQRVFKLPASLRVVLGQFSQCAQDKRQRGEPLLSVYEQALGEAKLRDPRKMDDTAKEVALTGG